MTKFSDLKLDPKVLQAIAEAGYETPTPIQAGAIPPALEGRDVLGIAQTGTGKTASFTLPMITLLGRGRARARMPRSLVLCPTRELAAQVAENFDTYAKHTRLTKALLIGGVSFGEQDKLIDRGVDVLIATPGRLLDHFERGKLLLTGVQIMVVDEADRMLDMGFIPDIERIFQLTPFTRQTLFFSATMAPEIERITNTFLHAPERVEVARQATASETITQRLIEISPTRRDQASKQKRELLRAVIDAEGTGLKNAIIFCNRKTDVDIVAKSLAKHGYDAAPIHGDLDQSHRTRTLESFRDGSLRLLVASDVAARGLDIPAVSHVINFDLPSHAEDYIHRIGRTGRAGRLGTAISLGTPQDEKLLSAIENLVKQSLPRGELPPGFVLSEGPEDGPRARHDDRKPRGDKRGGRSRRRDDDRDVPAPAPAAAPVAALPDAPAPPRDEVTQPAPRSDARPAPAPEASPAPRRDDGTESRPEPRSENRTEWRTDRPRDERRDQNGRDRRYRGRDSDRGPAVMGMGDHVPEFMLVEIRHSAVSDDAPEPIQTEVEVAPATAAAPEAVSKPRRSRGRKPSARAAELRDETAEGVSPQHGAPAGTGSPEAGPEQVASEQDVPEQVASASARPKRTRRKKTEAANADAAVPATSDDAAAQPADVTEDAPAKAPRARRSRKSAAPTDADADAASAEVAATPRRSRARKAPAADTAGQNTTRQDTEAPDMTGQNPDAPKPRRSRRKKTDDSAPSGDAAARNDADAGA